MRGTAPERLAPDAAGIARAAELLCGGELVAVPTETVYGLAARADSEQAVAAIFRAKGRPDFNPLIVHVASLAMAHRLGGLDSRAEKLAERFWPGPLTLVVPSRPDSPVVPAVTAGLSTIALRMPDHPATRALLDAVGLPLAAPSANPSGSVSPTTPGHVADGLGEQVAAILDGGPCPRGVESTIVALREGGDWQLLRPGPIGEDELVALLGPPTVPSDARIEAPGQLARHYSPGKPLRLGAAQADADEFLIGFGPVAGECSLSENGDLALAAARLYACLHAAAASPKRRIAVSPIPEVGIGAAINDRLRRAAA
jgi:L-threonylcarbamoyladenylate synthase